MGSDWAGEQRRTCDQVDVEEVERVGVHQADEVAAFEPDEVVRAVVRCGGGPDGFVVWSARSTEAVAADAGQPLDLFEARVVEHQVVRAGLGDQHVVVLQDLDRRELYFC
jgi:hypothetical protein